MRKLSDIELKKIELLTKHSISFTIIEPTETWIHKSIMDATWPVRNYLIDENIHNYELQDQWPQGKIMIDSLLLNDEECMPSQASLYRPLTKAGDPRIWFYWLKKFVKPNDILGIIAFRWSLIVLNLTQVNLSGLLYWDHENILKEIVNDIALKSNGTVIELLQKLEDIKKLWPVPSIVNGDTSVGRTLETLLWIDINSSKKPDYKGIELKSFREKKWNRKTLFAQVPNWKQSKFKSSAEILDSFWYERWDNFRLYCTVSSVTINSQWLSLEVDHNSSMLLEKSNDQKVWNFVVWTLDTLHSRLLEKHNETFWITAESLMIEGKEHFLYKSVEHTKNPIVSQFDILLERWIITVDHLIKRDSNNKVKEKGPLFKIKPNFLNLLFPPSETYDIL